MVKKRKSLVVPPKKLYDWEKDDEKCIWILGVPHFEVLVFPEDEKKIHQGKYGWLVAGKYIRVVTGSEETLEKAMKRAEDNLAKACSTLANYLGKISVWVNEIRRERGGRRFLNEHENFSLTEFEASSEDKAGVLASIRGRTGLTLEQALLLYKESRDN
jgi:hypothetical protein